MVGKKDLSYAQQIYNVLMDTEHHKMTLEDIYEWFSRHTDRTEGSKTKGWQKSIRHNLSMNHVSVGDHFIHSIRRCCTYRVLVLLRHYSKLPLTPDRLSKKFKHPLEQ